MAFTLPQDLLQREITEPQPGELPSWRSVRRIWRLSFTRALAPEDLERFRMHAQYVRAVDAYSYRRSAFVLSPATWCKLERVLEQGCLPNLRSLIKDDIVSCTVEPMHIFLSDNLRHLEYRFYDLEREDQPGGGISEWVEGWVLGLLTGITHHTSDIRVFHLLINPASSALCAELFLEALPKLTSVVSFQVPNFIYTPPSALSILADFAQLHNLAIAVRCEDFRSGTPDLPQGSFPALRTLTIVSDSSSWCVAFLSKICSPHVATIFKVNMPASSDDFLGFSNTLSGHPSADVVRTLALIFDPGPTPVALPPPVITPLYTLRSMEEIRIEGGCYAALDDDAFARMVLSWPSIQIVNVCSTSSKSSYPGVTLSGLASVIEHCRNIVSLMIRLEDIDEREITALLARKPPRIFELVPAVADDPTADARLVRRPFCPLDMLGVGSSRITEAHVGGVAAVLSLWFPLLDDILYCSRFTLAEIDGGIAQDGTPLDVDTVEQNNLWREVMTMISAMATARSLVISSDQKDARRGLSLASAIGNMWFLVPVGRDSDPSSMLAILLPFPSHRRHVVQTHSLMRLRLPRPLPFVRIDAPAQPELVIHHISGYGYRAQHALSGHARPQLQRRLYSRIEVEVLQHRFLRPFALPQILQRGDRQPGDVRDLQACLAHRADAALVLDLQRDYWEVLLPSQHSPDAPDNVCVVCAEEVGLRTWRAPVCGGNREDPDTLPHG